MHTHLLITRPNFDLTTSYLHEWSRAITNAAEKRGIVVFDLEGHKACRKALMSFVKKKGLSLVIFNAHGTETAVFGQKEEILMDIRDCSKMKSKTIYSRSCRSGATLGPALVREGARAFIGYKRDFIFPYDTNSTTNPLNDRISKPVLECSNMVAISLVKGKSAVEAHEKSLELYESYIRQYVRDPSPEAPQIIKSLLWNRTNQICLES